MPSRSITAVLGGLISIGLLAACSRPAAPAPPTAAPGPSPAPPTATVSPTPEPLAARVNGRPITLAAFEREVTRYQIGQAELGIDPGTAGDYQTAVLDQMITAALIAQAAEVAGVKVSDSEVEAEYNAVMESAGGQEALNAWMEKHLFTPEEFRAALREQLAASAVQNQIAASVPTLGEQVRARHIVVASQAEAVALLQQLKAGAEFATLAYTYSLDLSTRTNGGDLGWFPRGRLTVPEVEQAVFDLAPGEYGPVVASALGYHVVQTLERDPAHALTPDDYQVARQHAVEKWIDGLRASATIERFVAAAQ